MAVASPPAVVSVTMNYTNHEADGESFQSDDDKEHHDHPAEMLENVYTLPSSDQFFASEETCKQQWCLQLHDFMHCATFEPHYFLYRDIFYNYNTF